MSSRCSGEARFVGCLFLAYWWLIVSASKFPYATTATFWGALQWEADFRGSSALAIAIEYRYTLSLFFGKGSWPCHHSYYVWGCSVTQMTWFRSLCWWDPHSSMMISHFRWCWSWTIWGAQVELSAAAVLSKVNTAANSAVHSQCGYAQVPTWACWGGCGRWGRFVEMWPIVVSFQASLWSGPSTSRATLPLLVLTVSSTPRPRFADIF